MTLPVLTSPPHGGFNPWINSAVQGNGKVFIAYTDGETGDAAVIERDESTGVVTGPTVLHSALEGDDHDAPALAIRSDGHLVAIYGQHNNSSIYRRVSTNAYDSTSWGSETNLDSQLGGTRYTDWQLHNLSGTLYLLVRDEPSAGTDSRWDMSHSTDGGSTWTGLIEIQRIVSHRSYVVSWNDGVSKIHFVATSATDVSPYKIAHYYFDANDGNLHKSDGTVIGAAGGGPITDVTDATVIYSGSVYATPINVALDGSGEPVATYVTVDTPDFKNFYARWDGSEWNSTSLATYSGGYVYDTTAGAPANQPYELCLDDGDPNVVYDLVPVSGQVELFRRVTTDGGATFTSSQLTSGSSGFVATPIPIRNPASGGLRVAWQYGTWTDYTDYSLGIKASSGLTATSKDLTIEWQIAGKTVSAALGDALTDESGNLLTDESGSTVDGEYLNWGIQSAVGADLTSEWELRNTAGADLNLEWEIEGNPVGADLNLSWQVARGKGQKSTGGGHRVVAIRREPQPVHTDLRLSWQIAAPVAARIAAAYSIRQTVRTAVPVTWAIEPFDPMGRNRPILLAEMDEDAANVMASARKTA